MLSSPSHESMSLDRRGTAYGCDSLLGLAAWFAFLASLALPAFELAITFPLPPDRSLLTVPDMRPVETIMGWQVALCSMISPFFILADAGAATSILLCPANVLLLFAPILLFTRACEIAWAWLTLLFGLSAVVAVLIVVGTRLELTPLVGFYANIAALLALGCAGAIRLLAGQDP